MINLEFMLYNPHRIADNEKAVIKDHEPHPNSTVLTSELHNILVQ